MIKPPEVLRAEEALTLFELSQLLRLGLRDGDILQDVQRRGLVDALDESGERYLQNCKASAALIQALKNYDYVLTDVERQNYFARASARLESGRGSAARPLFSDTERAERKRQLDLQRQTIADAERTQMMEAKRVAKMDAETAGDRAHRTETNDRSSQTTALRSIYSGSLYVPPGYRPRYYYVDPRYPSATSGGYSRTPVEQQQSFISKKP